MLLHVYVYSMYGCTCIVILYVAMHVYAPVWEERHCQALELNYQSINQSINLYNDILHAVARPISNLHQGDS